MARALGLRTRVGWSIAERAIAVPRSGLQRGGVRPGRRSRACPGPARLGGELPRAATGSWTGTEYRQQQPTPVPAAYDPAAYSSGAHRECAECGRPVRIAGELCPPCAGYDRCADCGKWAPPEADCPQCTKKPDLQE